MIFGRASSSLIASLKSMVERVRADQPWPHLLCVNVDALKSRGNIALDFPGASSRERPSLVKV
jgi:hypothetical protein